MKIEYRKTSSYLVFNIVEGNTSLEFFLDVPEATALLETLADGVDTLQWYINSEAKD